MEVKWTDAQKKAIGAFGKGAVVSAAAGSGKTAVLIERIIHLLCDKERNIPADRLLAVTFTIDAAAQMRDKLADAFEKKLAEDPGNEWLIKQQTLSQLAKISTIDSFCLDLVKENLHRFEFQGGLKMLGETESGLMFNNAHAQALEELCRDAPEDYALLDNFLGLGNVQSCVKVIYDHLRSICFADKWKNEALELYRDEKILDTLREDRFKALEETAAHVGVLMDDVRYCYNYSVRVGGEVYELRQYSGTIESNMQEFASAESELRLLAAHRDESRISALTVPKHRTMRISSKAPGEFSFEFSVIKDRMTEDLKEISGLFSKVIDLFRFSDEHYMRNFRTEADIFRVLVALVDRVDELMYEVKLEKNSVDFADIELMAKELLVRETDKGFERTELAQDIRESGLYKIIMLDEYQDVNDIQEIIFKSISDTDDLEIMGKNTFIVGDMKQAIYGFRKSNPYLFKNAIIKSREESYSDRLKHISLNRNFRSRKEVLGFSNFVFSNIMSEECGEVEYNADERLEFGAKDYPDKRVPCEVMLMAEDDSVSRKDEDFPLEFRQVALRIRELIDGGELVWEKDHERPCRQSDFCILVTRNDYIKQAALALESVGLSAFSEDTEGYLEAREVSLALDLLRVVDNPMNDIALAAVMMSSVMGFSPDEMVAVRSKCFTKGGTNHIYQVLSGADKQSGLDEKYAKYVDMGSETLQRKCSEVYRLIESLRYCSMSMSLERLIRRIFDVTDLMGLTSLYLDSAKKRANLRLLLEYASDYEKNGSEGVTGFLRYIDSVSKLRNPFKNAVSVAAGEDSVRVITYHRSKGLEYPFVFLCSLAKGLVREERFNQKLRIHSSKGFGFRLNDRRLMVQRDNPYLDHLDAVINNELRSERMRLLYVGCTRAKEKLFVVCNIEKKGRTKISKTYLEHIRNVLVTGHYRKIPGTEVQHMSSMLDWVLVCLARHPSREPLEKWLHADLGFIEISENAKEADIVYRICENDRVNTLAASEDIEEVTPEPDRALTQKLLNKYTFLYDGEPMLPAKLSVTEIVQAEKEKLLRDKNPEFFPNLPRLSDELDKLSASEKGTCTHKFMELADYGRARLSVRDELERLKKEGFFTEREAKGVYVESLERFFKSEFFERMMSSPDLRREQRFLASVEDLGLSEELSGYTGGDGMIQGIADCIFKEGDGWVLVDYKTDNFKSEDDMKKYSTQLKLYKAAFELIYGEPVRSSYIYSFKLGVGLEFRL